MELTDVPDELRLSIAGGLSFEASVPDADVNGRFVLAAEDKVDVAEAADVRLDRSIFGVDGLVGLTPAVDTVDAADVLRERDNELG